MKFAYLAAVLLASLPHHGLWVTSTWYVLGEPGEEHVFSCGGAWPPGRNYAAHRTLPCGTRVRVTSADTHRSVIVVIKDAGPWVLVDDRGRSKLSPRSLARSCRSGGTCRPPPGWWWRDEVDLSRGAWTRLGLHPATGWTRVRLQVLAPPPRLQAAR